jgi:hypothetical protein
VNESPETLLEAFEKRNLRLFHVEGNFAQGRYCCSEWVSFLDFYFQIVCIIFDVSAYIIGFDSAKLVEMERKKN